MESAYMRASGDDTLPANARQIMYAARGRIQEMTGKQLDPHYFTQELLPNYVLDTGVDWDVIYDARGHFNEPHDGESFGVGTLEVRDYLGRLHEPSFEAAGFKEAKTKTCGPNGNFGAVLFIEKEGFDPLMRAAGIADKYDCAIMSTKGMSVIAARALADEVCHEYDIPLLVMRDLDKAGFSITGSFQRDSDRYEFQNSIRVINLGLNLEDVEAMGLEAEYQHHKKASKFALINNLRKNGASDEEIAFMFRDFDGLRSTRRVELNAMTSPQFIDFVERKLQEHGIKKIIPDDGLLADAYRLAVRSREAQEVITRELEKLNGKDAEPPSDLTNQVRQYLETNPETRWDEAVRKIVTTYFSADDRGGAES